jgi:hypothetical protein
MGDVIKVNTTVVAVVAPPGSRPPLAAVSASNVRIVRPSHDAPELDRAIETWREARHTSSPYLLHDADPLALVADAWVRRFDGSGAVGDLEVAVAETLARWRARALDLPDYYLVVEPEALGPTHRHWYFGVLGAAAPSRVVVPAASAPVAEHLGELRPGPWWPDMDRLLADIDHLVPDQAEAFVVTEPATGLVV